MKKQNRINTCWLAAGQAGAWLLLAGLLLWTVPGIMAQGTAHNGLNIQMSQVNATMQAGDWLAFQTILTNDGTLATPPIAAHLSVAAVDQSRHVDPEDWSPHRTHYLPPLQPSEQVELRWELHALFEGQFATFITILSVDGNFGPTMSQPLIIQVTPDNILPWSTVIPVVAMVPIFPLTFLLGTAVSIRRKSKT